MQLNKEASQIELIRGLFIWKTYIWEIAEFGRSQPFRDVALIEVKRFFGDRINFCQKSVGLFVPESQMQMCYSISCEAINM